MIPPFDPDQDHGFVRGDPRRAFVQNGWYYDAEGNAVEKIQVSEPSPMAVRRAQTRVQARPRKPRADPGSELMRQIMAENAAALAAEELAE